MSSRDISLEKMKQMFLAMLKIRLSEEMLADLLIKKEVNCPVHLCTGQEAVAAGVCLSLNQDDYVFGGHRSHGHYLAKGGNLKGMFAEIYGKSEGCSGGRGGSMHLFSPQNGILGTVPIVAATIPIAVGAALTIHLKKRKQVAVSFFGDGATEEGTFHESMNFAALKKLPIIFVCENNFYSSHLHILERRVKDNLSEMATGHGMFSEVIDGNNCLTVYEATQRAIEKIHRNEGPTFLECRTFRWRGHVGPSWDLDVGVKRKDDLEAWKKQDPIPQLEKILIEKGIEVTEIKLMHSKVQKEIEEAVDHARKGNYPDMKDLSKHVYYSKPRGNK